MTKKINWTARQWRKFAELCGDASKQCFPGIRFADAKEQAEIFAERLERAELSELQSERGNDEEAD